MSLERKKSTYRSKSRSPKYKTHNSLFIITTYNSPPYHCRPNWMFFHHIQTRSSKANKPEINFFFDASHFEKAVTRAVALFRPPYYRNLDVNLNSHSLHYTFFIHTCSRNLNKIKRIVDC